ncbi:hypothetical protein J1N35_009409 [Gossypium stocksii]|uniref:CENP-V/GFA domain-containing protein n=1 Tax=Gossypium stocksii TaxID=47602 RepID=A0A9D3VYE7_9ROSI|nr:hypothetical protein J1N35_009409 [Gossypium stocksii]
MVLDEPCSGREWYSDKVLPTMTTLVFKLSPNARESSTVTSSKHLLDKLVLTIVVVGMDSELVLHYGGCHCKNVRWHVQAPTSVVAWKCNCSNCSMRGTIHFVVPRQRFELLGDSEEFITTYTFGTHTAKHTFCKVCGITSFYTQRSNPNGIAVTLACLDPGTLSHVEIRHFNGKNL